jgi:NADPH:quinone reductase-like Zn-dependent oxidoreductase
MTCRECVTGRDHWCAFAEQFGIHRNGGYAELVNVPARNIYRMPDWMTYEEAAAIPLAFKTAWHMMVEKAKLEPGEDVLIQAVGSGVGSAALQVAAFFGCRALVTAGADWKLDTALRDWGADAGINYRTEDVAKRILELTDGKGVDLVVDSVGVDTFESSLRSLRKDGRYVLCGVTSGHKAEVHLGQVFTRGLAIMGVGWWRNAEFATVWKLAERRIFKGVVAKTFPLAQAREAHAFMEGRDFYGKIVLKP